MSKEEIEKLLHKIPYRKPEIKKEPGMNFVDTIWKSYLQTPLACHQCTSCHGCR